MKIIVWQGNWTIKDIEEHKDKIFVFGDNDRRIGKGGQAIIRDYKNTIGLRTKKAPSLEKSAFYNDDEFLENIKKIDEDITKIKDALEKGKTIVLSNGGYGTGLAKMPEKAPKTYMYLCNQLEMLLKN